MFVLPNPELSDLPAAAAFGPDSLVVAGSVLDEDENATHARMWVPRLALDGAHLSPAIICSSDTAEAEAARRPRSPTAYIATSRLIRPILPAKPLSPG
ncbi:hypothetical protein [Nannocystis pusilla]|uniref:hypothetical protein n=1 Tax=Nannocystis pusilla TaxID=889268 RepID=UPI003DA21982